MGPLGKRWPCRFSLLLWWEVLLGFMQQGGALFGEQSSRPASLRCPCSGGSMLLPPQHLLCVWQPPTPSGAAAQPAQFSTLWGLGHKQGT